jgi:hypothetical protein
VAARREALQLALPHLSAAARALRAAIAAAAPPQQQRSSAHSPRGRTAREVSVPLGALEAMQSVGALPDALLPYVNAAHAAADAAAAAAAAAAKEEEEDVGRVHARPARASSHDTASAPTRGEQLMAAATTVDFSPAGALRRAPPAPPVTPAAPRRAAPPPPPPPRA